MSEPAALLQPSPAALARFGRENNFDFLRFVLASAVILSHSYSMVRGKETEWMMRWSKGQTDLGSTAVDGFFILSGYLIAQSFLNSSSVWSYFRKRIGRIYPGFLVAAVVSLCLFGPLGADFDTSYWHAVQPLKFLIRLPVLKDLWIPQSFTSNYWPYVNPPPWTIQYEFVCYLLVAILGLLALLRRPVWIVAIFAACYLFNIIQVPWHLSLYNWKEMHLAGKPDFYPRFFTYFLAGTLAYLYRDQIRYTTIGIIVAATAVVAAAVMGRELEAALPVAGTYLLFAFAFSPRIRIHHWARPGDFSYGLYLYGWPVQQTVIMVLGRNALPVVVFGLAMMVTMGFAVASWYLVERPFLKRTKHHLPQ